MKRLRAWVRRLAGLVPNEQRERELAEEIESNVQMHIEDNLRRGMTPEEARRHAYVTLGGVESTKEAWRDRSTLPGLENLLQDLRFSFRQLRKNAGFTATAVLMLGLGTCASVAVFAFVDATLIRPLPYREPNRLVGVYEHTERCAECNLSFLDYLDWKQRNKVFRSLDAYVGNAQMLRTSAGPVRTRGASVSDGFFRTLGIQPALGRDFYAGEDSRAASRTAIVSYATWQNRFSGRKDVIGQTATLDDAMYTVIGVLPRNFHFAPMGRPEFWTTLNIGGNCEIRRSCHNLYGVARLRDGVSIDRAQAETAGIARQLEKQFPNSNLGQGASVVPLTEAIVGKNRILLLTLLAAAGLLLVIACVNVTTLVLVRSESRRRELAVRSALGASRTRLIRQFITEGLVLVTIGTGVGLLSGYGAMQLMSKLIPEDMLANMPYLEGLGLNGHVVAFAAGVAFLSASLFSVTPAVRVLRPDLRAGLTEGSRGSAGNTWRRLGAKLVVLELSTAMVLLVGAGLLGRSFYRLLQVDVGLAVDHLATLQVSSPDSKYGKTDQAIRLQRQILARISHEPGVQSAATCSQLPVSYNGNTDWIRFVGKPYNGQHNEVNQRDVSAGYFPTAKAKLLRGRNFRDDEDGTKPRVTIINRALARLYFPGENPVGRQIGDDVLSPASLREIIGVVDDIREGPLDEPMMPTEYFPFNQDAGNNFAIIVRTSQEERSVFPAIVSAIRQIDPEIVTTGAASMNRVIHDAPSTYLRRSSAWLLAGFAGSALLLGVVGLYGVVAYSVSQRTREIGVRMALGAQRGTVYSLILKEAAWLVALGVGLGLGCSIGAATLIRNLLFATPAWDAATLGAVAVVLGLSALTASYIPARRAASVNPVDALRTE